MIEEIETNNLKDSTKKASPVERLVSWYIGNEKRKLKREIARSIKKCFIHEEDDEAWTKQQFRINGEQIKCHDGCSTFYKAPTVIATTEKLLELIKELDS